MTSVAAAIAEKLPTSSELEDSEIIARVVAGEAPLFAVLMRRHNRRVFRAVRAIVKSDAEAEDAAQESWIAAYRGLESFAHRARFSTWITRIAIRKALRRVTRAPHMRSLEELDRLQLEPTGEDPERAASRRELARILERAIDGLAPSHRVVIMLRDVENMSTAEAAAALEVSEANLRVRLHRARGALRDRLTTATEDATLEAFGFDGERCDRIVREVFSTLLGELGRNAAQRELAPGRGRRSRPDGL